MQLPLSFLNNPTLVELARPKTYAHFVQMTRGQSEESCAALTDIIEEKPVEKVTVTNPGAC